MGAHLLFYGSKSKKGDKRAVWWKMVNNFMIMAVVGTCTQKEWKDGNNNSMASTLEENLKARIYVLCHYPLLVVKRQRQQSKKHSYSPGTFPLRRYEFAKLVCCIDMVQYRRYHLLMMHTGTFPTFHYDNFAISNSTIL